MFISLPSSQTRSWVLFPIPKDEKPCSPFTLEEKQILLETNNLNDRKEKLEQILSTYNFDKHFNKTIQ